MEINFKIEIDGIKPIVSEFLPQNAVSYWDDIEIHPIKELENGVCETVEAGEEDFWSVYLHQLVGGVKCVADLKTKQQATKLAELIINAANYRVYSKSL